MPDTIPDWAQAPSQDVPDWAAESQTEAPDWADQSKGVDIPLTTQALRNAGQAAKELVMGMIPKTPMQYAAQVFPPLAAFEQGKALAQGDISSIPIAGRVPEIIQAEKTPAFSKERFLTAGKTLMDLGLLAGAGAPEAKVGGEQYAKQPSYAQVQEGDIALGEQARPEGEVPKPSYSDYAQREAQGAAGEGTQPVPTGEPVAPTAQEPTYAPGIELKQGATVSEGIKAIQKAVEPWKAHSAATDSAYTNLQVALRRYGDKPLDDESIAKINAAISDLPRYLTGEVSGKPTYAPGAGVGDVTPLEGKVRKFSTTWDERGALESKAMMSPGEFARFQYGTIPPDEVLPSIEANHRQIVADAIANGLRANPEAIRKYGLERAGVGEVSYDAEIHDQAVANVDARLKGQPRPPRGELFRLYDEEYKRLVARPEPAAVQPPAEVPPEDVKYTGVSNDVYARLTAEGQLGEVPTGAGRSTADSIAIGRARLQQGADPYAIASRFWKTRRISDTEFAVLRAESEQLHGASLAAEKAMKANPTPQNRAAYEQAFQAFHDFSKNVVQPAKTATSNIFRAMQDEEPIHVDSYTGIRDAMIQQKGRDIKPEERPVFERVADSVQAATNARNGEAAKIDAALKKSAPKARKLITNDDVRGHIADLMKRRFPCA